VPLLSGLLKKTVGMMGLKNVPGLNIVAVLPEYPDKNGGGGGGRGGGRGRAWDYIARHVFDMYCEPSRAYIKHRGHEE